MQTRGDMEGGCRQKSATSTENSVINAQHNKESEGLRHKDQTATARGGSPAAEVHGGDQLNNGGASPTTSSATPPPPGNQNEQTEELVPITVEFLPIKSPEIAQSLYRTDEAAYSIACKTSMLRVKKRNRPISASASPPGCLLMIQHGRAMKVQRRSTLWRIHEEEKRREYIAWELSVAHDKMESRARRTDVASVAWNEWCRAKGGKWSSPLAALLSSQPGRRTWKEYMESKLAIKGVPGILSRAPSPSDSQSPIPERHSDEGPTEDSLLKIEEGELFQASTKKIPEWSVVEITGRSATVTGDEEVVSGTDSSIALIKLHLALESLTTVLRHDTGGEGGDLDAARCAEFCAEWPMDRLPTFLDPSLLQPVRSIAEEVQSGKRRPVAGGVGRETSIPARKNVRLEVERLFFKGFLGARAGHAFVITAVQDGTLDPDKAKSIVSKLTEGAYFDEDAQGVRRMTVHGSDDWMNSRLVHEGVEQRIRVEAAEPWLRGMLHDANCRISVHRGELAVIVQYAYSLAALHAQSFVRGALARSQARQKRWDLLSYAVFCAAVEIQRVFRGAMARGRAHEVLVSIASTSLVPLQARIRGLLVRQRFVRKWADVFDQQAIKIQRVYRGHRCRGRIKISLKVKAWSQNFHLHGWASSVLQRQARVWLAKRAIHLKRVEVGLSSRVSEIAETLATAGDSRSVSSVLHQVDKDYRRYEKKIQDMQAKEGEMAATFVEKNYATYEEIFKSTMPFARQRLNRGHLAPTTVELDKRNPVLHHVPSDEKVLERRDVEIAGAWDSFVGAASKHAVMLKQQSNARRGHPIPASRNGAAELSGVYDRKLRQLMKRYMEPAHARTIPSAYLRGALPAHVKICGGWTAPKYGGGKASSTIADWNKKQPHYNKSSLSSNIVELSQLKDGSPFALYTRDVGGSSSADSSPNFGSSMKAAISSTLETETIATEEDLRFSSGRRRPHEGARTQAERRKNFVKACREGHSAGDGSAGSNSERYVDDKPIARDNKTPGKENLGNKTAATSTTRGTSGGISMSSFDPEKRRTSNDHARNSAKSGAGEWGEAHAVEVMGSLPWQRGWDEERTFRGLSGDTSSRFPGSSALQDMPSGLDETVERLCAAAFLRGHVPVGLLPSGTTPEEAYERYLELPPSLAKIRHEQLCREAAKPVAAALRARDFTVFRQLLPQSKLKHLFKEVGAGVGEALAAVFLARELTSPPTGSSQRGGSPSTSQLFLPLWSFSRQTSAGKTRDGNESGSLDGTGVRGDESKVSCRGRGVTVSGGDQVPFKEKPKDPRKISLTGLTLEGGKGCKQAGAEGWDPRRYTSSPENWLKPSRTIVKRRWDDKAKEFVCVNGYSFDLLYRRHHPLDPQNNGDEINTRENEITTSDNFYSDDKHEMVRREGGNAGGAFPPSLLASRKGGRGDHGGRLEEVMREENNTVLDGMTPNARELYQHIVNDTGSWGSVEDPIGNFLFRAAFYVVEHPSPATAAELAGAKEKNCLPKVPMGSEALREFVQELHAAMPKRTVSPFSRHTTPDTQKRVEGGQGGDNNSRTVGRYGFSSQDPRRILLERRLEAAENLALPFALRLEADGVSSVRMLARVPTRAWSLPSCLIEEVERMMGLLAVKTCTSNCSYDRRFRSNSKLDAARGSTAAGKGDINTASEKRAGGIGGSGGDVLKYRSKKRGELKARQCQRRHPLGYDPKFQRSAVDPSGRPPRFKSAHATINRKGGDVGRTLGYEDDLPPGLWDHPNSVDNELPLQNSSLKPAALHSAAGSSEASLLVGDNSITRSSSFVSFVRTTTPSVAFLNGQSELLDEQGGFTGPQRQRSSSRGELLDRRRYNLPNQRCPSRPSFKTYANVQSAVSRANGDGDKSRALKRGLDEPIAESPSRSTCRAPHCGATFSKIGTLRTHERSHATAPVYHRFRRAPQLFRDPPSAPSEGSGAIAARFRLRTELPASVQLELLQLQKENETRRRNSLLALPGLLGASATWAGVVMPGRNSQLHCV